MINLTKLSKTLSFVLRHNPASHGVIVDKEGWVDINQLIFQIRQRNPQFMAAHMGHIKEIIKNSDKQRFELKGNKIRAYYGHSAQQAVDKKPAVPPSILYQGTTPEAKDKILLEGLKPMTRQFVHLSTDRKTAHKVALRRTKTPVILIVDAKAVYLNGTKFYPGNEDIWLAEYIDPKYITVDECR
jgi:putative RNA 2'-phosphotransferase